MSRGRDWCGGAGRASWGAVTQSTTLRWRSTAVEPLPTLALYLGGWTSGGGGAPPRLPAEGCSHAASVDHEPRREWQGHVHSLGEPWEQPSHGPQEGPSGLQLARQRVPQRHPWGRDTPGGEPPPLAGSAPSGPSPPRSPVTSPGLRPALPASSRERDSLRPVGTEPQTDSHPL